MKQTKGKLPVHLVDPEALEEMARVLEFGATKYAPNRWRGGLKYDEYLLAAIERHRLAIRKGEDRDPETGLLHSAHIMCEAMFLTYFLMHPEQFKWCDDRIGNGKV